MRPKHVRGCPLFTHPTQRGPNHPTDCRCPDPTPGTQTARILAELRSNATITPLQALECFGCFRLAARISDLREQGYPIVTEWLTTSNGRRHARYRLVRVEEQMVVGL